MLAHLFRALGRRARRLTSRPRREYPPAPLPRIRWY